MSYADERHDRNDRYQEALTALAKARVAFWSWDVFAERKELGNVLGLVEELSYEADRKDGGDD